MSGGERSFAARLDAALREGGTRPELESLLTEGYARVHELETQDYRLARRYASRAAATLGCHELKSLLDERRRLRRELTRLRAQLAKLRASLGRS